MSTVPQPLRRRRDAARSRRVILDAAEALFARHGYDATSMGAIARRARVSSALPAYFFADKDGLYRAVLERCFADRERRLEPLADEVVAALARGGGLPDALHHLIDGYVGFLAQRPAFVRLIGWEALRGARQLRAAPRHSAAVERALRAALATGDQTPAPRLDPDQLLISVTALCFFPFEHGDTMLSAMGIDAAAPAFINARKAHVVDALTQIIAPR
jgi:TetR/AcrR family transcriptional regulator